MDCLQGLELTKEVRMLALVSTCYTPEELDEVVL